MCVETDAESRVGPHIIARRYIYVAVHELKARGLPVVCIDARRAKAALSLKINKTDTNDACGIAQIIRVGWYKEVTVKSMDTRRALLAARTQLVCQLTTLKNTVRGILGLIVPPGSSRHFEQRIREMIDGQVVLTAVLTPLLATLDTLRLQTAWPKGPAPTRSCGG
jgi:transposase